MSCPQDAGVTGLRRRMLALLPLLALLLPVLTRAADTPTKVGSDNPHISFNAVLPGTKPEDKEPPLIFSTRVENRVHIDQHVAQQSHELNVTVIQGKMKELALVMSGDGEILQVTGPGLLDWGTRRGTNDQRYLVVHTLEAFQTTTNLNFSVKSQTTFTNAPFKFSPIALSPAQPALFDGVLWISQAPEWTVTASDLQGLAPMDPKFFNGSPERSKKVPPLGDVLVYRFSGAAYGLVLNLEETDPDLRKVRFNDFRLSGEVHGETASFVLTGKAVVKHPEGGVLEALSGEAALTAFKPQARMVLELEQGSYRLKFLTNGTYDIELKFDARIHQTNGWRSLSFNPPAGALRPVELIGIPEQTQVRFHAAAEAKRVNHTFVSYLPATGPMQFQWQEARPEVEGKLFFAVTAASQITVSPGLIRQIDLFEYKVMQGELKDLVLIVDGEGEVLRVQGNGILNWTIEGDNPAAGRRLIVRLNQAQKDVYTLAVQTQMPLSAFPLSFKPVRLSPQGAIRYGGHLRVINSGAVRLEVLNAPGLAQISPQRFPEVKALGELTERQQAQAFAYRFSGPDFGLEIQADNVLPEVTLSQLVVYHLGETETTIEAELELEIREAPLREFELLVPAGFGVASLNVPNLSDHSLGTTPDAAGTVPLKIQFGQPLMGRQVLQLRLTRGHATPDPSWTLVPLKAQRVKAVRGFVGAGADAGLRLTETQAQGLTEIATAFFPKKIKDLQLAYRLRDEAWAVTLASERLALSIQVDALQLFSIGEGIAYGSTVFNYNIAGAPVGTFKILAPTNYSNIEFVGQDIRHWKKTEQGFEVYLHTPVSGTYSLLATYDMPFNPRGEVMSFNGLQPIEVQSEQGHIIVVSTYQFQTQAVEVSPGLIPLEPGEVPTEYRLLFDAPLLSAYQYSSRPYQARLRLAALGQGDTVNQVVDRATFTTHVSGEGQAWTDIDYLIKSKGFSHLRLSVPPDATLWSAMVNNQKVVPVVDQAATLIPLPQNTAPNTVIPVSLKLAVKSGNPTRVTVALPKVTAPVLLANWQIQPDAGFRLGFQAGNLVPVQAPEDISGFAWLSGLLRGRFGPGARPMALLGVVLLLVGALLWRWGTRPGLFRFGLANLLGAGLGLVAFVVALVCLVQLTSLASHNILTQSTALSFVVPVQAPDGALAVTLKNQELDKLAGPWITAWPVYVAILLWAYVYVAQTGFLRPLGVALGWTLAFWGCLRVPNGGAAFFLALTTFALLHIVLPLIRRQRQLPRKPKEVKVPEPPAEPEPSPAGGAAGWVILASLLLGATSVGQAAVNSAKTKPIVIESVSQSARVDKERVVVQSRLRWIAVQDQALDFLHAPAVLTKITYPQSALKLVQESADQKAVYRLNALESGAFEIAFEYEMAVEQVKGVSGFHLPTSHGLINRFDLDLDRLEVEVESTDIVSSRPATNATPVQARSQFSLVLSPVDNAWVAWVPRSRDTRAEKPVFYAELFQLFIPTSGIIEGVHDVEIRPAQGQLSQLAFRTPEKMTITDVQAQSLSGWKFDPDTRTLRVQFEPAQARPFAVRLRSQVTTSPLPFEVQVGLITVEQAASQHGKVGLATGAEVQLGTVTPVNLTTNMLEDFPAQMAADQAAEIPGIALRRAYGYSDPLARLTLSASAVQPDIRVVAQQTLSLGEDRTLLAARLDVGITRAGVFKLSFTLPDGMDVESITGSALSHWTELRVDNARVITLHLQGKTEGNQSFALNLTGPGVGAVAGWETPRLFLREATKQTGQLIVVPEQGMRLHIGLREGLTQLDPKAAGINQKGVLAFRLLQDAWRVTFDIEKVDPWIQVESLQDMTVREGQIKGIVTMDYTIENAGVKSLFVQLPANAEGVHFTGDQVADAVKTATANTNIVEWEVKLDRRVLGSYKLQLHYQVGATGQSQLDVVAGVQVKQVNLQRAYMTIRTSGRLQLNIPQLPPALQTVDWRSIPAALRGPQAAAEGNYTFRAIEPEFALGLSVIRHAAAKLLPARVEKTEFTSALSDAGEMLTQVKLTLQPGDMRLLKLKLPAQARFWFAFVNNAGVWPWQESDSILIPMEQTHQPGQSSVVEFLYSLPTTARTGRAADFGLLAPAFELPLEDITWQVFLPQDRELEDWQGALQLQTQTLAPLPSRLDVQSYLQSQSTQQKEQTREAESMLQLANDFLVKGEQQQARKAFSSAYNLSQHDDAFNEDARVQLHNLKMQQALVGLNYRRNAVFQDQAAQAGGAQGTNAALAILAPNQEQPQYTQQQVKQALEGNTAEDNSALMKLAEHLIEQQDAAQVAPEAIRATLPEMGNRLTFKRSVLVDTMTPLNLNLETKAAGISASTSRFGMLLSLFLGAAVFMVLARKSAV